LKQFLIYFIISVISVGRIQVRHGVFSLVKFLRITALCCANESAVQSLLLLLSRLPNLHVTNIDYHQHMQ